MSACRIREFLRAGRSLGAQRGHGKEMMDPIAFEQS